MDLVDYPYQCKFLIPKFRNCTDLIGLAVAIAGKENFVYQDKYYEFDGFATVEHWVTFFFVQADHAVAFKLQVDL